MKKLIEKIKARIHKLTAPAYYSYISEIPRAKSTIEELIRLWLTRSITKLHPESYVTPLDESIASETQLVDVACNRFDRSLLSTWSLFKLWLSQLEKRTKKDLAKLLLPTLPTLPCPPVCTSPETMIGQQTVIRLQLPDPKAPKHSVLGLRRHSNVANLALKKAKAQKAKKTTTKKKRK